MRRSLPGVRNARMRSGTRPAHTDVHKAFHHGGRSCREEDWITPDCSSSRRPPSSIFPHPFTHHKHPPLAMVGHIIHHQSIATHVLGGGAGNEQPV